jgi:Tfp pilus assembly protein PilO
MHEASVAYVLVRSQVMMIVILGYQFYLAVGSELIEDTLKNVERVSSWPIQALNIGLFVLVLGICWLYLKSTRADLAKLQTANENERKEYIDSLKTMVSDMGKIIERNNVIFDRIDKRLERIERAADIAPSVR